MIKWMVKNKEWLFSGVGVAIILAIFSIFSGIRKRKEEIITLIIDNKKLIFSDIGIAVITAVIVIIIIGIIAIIKSVISYLLSSREEQKLATPRESSEQLLIAALKEVVQREFLAVKQNAQKLAKTTDDAEKKKEVGKFIDSLDESIKGINKDADDLVIWREAARWLEKNLKSLTNEAFDHVIEENKALTKPGGSLSSRKNKKEFKKSIHEHLVWVLKKLNLEPCREKLENIRIIPGPASYKTAFEFVWNQIEEAKNQKGYKQLSSSAARVLQKYIKHYLIKRVVAK